MGAPVGIAPSPPVGMPPAGALKPAPPGGLPPARQAQQAQGKRERPPAMTMVSVLMQGWMLNVARLQPLV